MKASGDYRERAEAVVKRVRFRLRGALDLESREAEDEHVAVICSWIAQAIEDAANAARLEEREACACLADPVDDVLASVIRARWAAQGTPGEEQKR